MIYILFAFLTIANASFIEIKGLAKSPKDSQLIYTEEHKITRDQNGFNKKIETKYFDSQGKLFAEMTSDFSKNLTIPDTKFKDFRFNRSEELIFNESTNTVVFKSQKGSDKEKIQKTSLSENMVAGQGFDNFIKMNFEDLRKKSVPLSFGVLSEMNFYSFKGYKKKQTKDNLTQFGIGLSNLFLSFFLSELIIEYNPETKQIVSYKGLSNILSETEKPQSVHISYETIQKQKTP